MPRGSRPSSAAAKPLPRNQFASHESSDDPVSRTATRPSMRSAGSNRAPSGPSGGSDARSPAVDPATATSQVKPSRKTRVDTAKGAYAPVDGHAGAFDSSDPDRSPPPSDSEMESVHAPTQTKRKQGKRALADSDLEKSRGGESESEGWSTTKKLVIGGLALLAVVVHGSKASEGSSATSSADSLASHANGTASVASDVSSASASSNFGAIGSIAPLSAVATGLPPIGASGALVPTVPQQPVQTGVVTSPASLTSTVSIGAFEEVPYSTGGSTSAGAAAAASGIAKEHAPFGLTASLTDPGADLAPLGSLTGARASILPAFDGGASTAASEKPAFPSGVDTAQSVSAQIGTTKMSTTATWFGASQHLSACHEVFDDAALVAAVHPALFGSDGSTPSELCDARLHIWQPDSDQTITVSIQDVCSHCPTPTAIDLTQAAFLKLAPDRDSALDQGVLPIQWWFDDIALQQRLPIGFDQWSRE